MDDCITEESQMAAHERAALALWLLLQAPLTTQVLAQRLGLTYDGTRYLLNNISRSVPLYQDEGVWRILKIDD